MSQRRKANFRWQQRFTRGETTKRIKRGTYYSLAQLTTEHEPLKAKPWLPTGTKCHASCGCGTSMTRTTHTP